MKHKLQSNIIFIIKLFIMMIVIFAIRFISSRIDKNTIQGYVYTIALSLVAILILIIYIHMIITSIQLLIKYYTLKNKSEFQKVIFSQVKSRLIALVIPVSTTLLICSDTMSYAVSYVFIDAIALLFFIIYNCTMYTGFENARDKEIKCSIVKDIGCVKFDTNIENIDIKTLVIKGILNNYTKSIAKYDIQYELDNIQYRLFDVKLYNISKNTDTITKYNVVQQVLIFESEHIFTKHIYKDIRIATRFGSTFNSSDKLESDIDTGIDSFSEQFVVKAENAEDAFELLSKQVIENMLQFKKKHNRFSILFDSGILYLTIYNNKGIFDKCDSETGIDKQKAIHNIVEPSVFMTSIIYNIKYRDNL